ncbi:hypothetical protein ACIQ1D_19170 [Lysinibacillus xylanilyticus]|uniref:hypothetical protein n=1 Tax=Lysinibacillus xylanilyticus TaxID=582475 RepID=UPI0038226821
MNTLEDVTETQDGWFYSPRFHHAQKVNQNVYCYVSNMLYGYVVQLYMRGDTGFCKLEARSSTRDLASLIKMFELGEKWLEKYSSGNTKEIDKDFFSISNSKGAWRVGSIDYWI